MALKFTELYGFKDVKTGDTTTVINSMLKQLGYDKIYAGNPSNNYCIYSIGSLTLLGNTYYGVKLMPNRAQSSSYAAVDYLTMNFPDAFERLGNKALQIGFRITQPAVSENMRGQKLFSCYAGGTNILNSFEHMPSTAMEDTSVYYELVMRRFTQKDSRLTKYWTCDVYINKQKVYSQQTSISKGQGVTLYIGQYFTLDTAQLEKNPNYALLIGDIYVAELDYTTNTDGEGICTPQLFGSLTIEPFKIKSYSGDKHKNTKNGDILTALNGGTDLTQQLGDLAIKPVEQPASVTFNMPDTAGKSIAGVALSILYKDSVAPNNRLHYKITEGTTQLAEETISTRVADDTGYTRFNKVFLTPPNGGTWDANNLTFKMDIFNRAE